MARFGTLTAFAAQGAQSAGFMPVDGLLLIVVGAFFGIFGLLAYTGKSRRWTSSPQGRAFPYFPFGLAWMGAGIVIVGIFGLISALGTIAAYISVVVFALPGFALFFCGLAFVIRTPRRFLPTWYLEYRGHAKRSR
jgi:apolipoprotein N-acyltransferase